MARFLLCTMPITGHVNPGLPIARALVGRGHEVWWYTGRRFQERIEATGARYVPMRDAIDFDDRAPEKSFPGAGQRSGLAALKWDIKHIFYDSLPGQLSDLRRTLRSFPADALLADTAFLGAAALYELGGPPYAVFGITALTLSSRDTAPFGSGLAPSASLLGRLRNRALAALFDAALFRDVNTYANKIRAALSLPPLAGNALDIKPPLLYLHSATPVFEYPRSDLPPQVHFVGPLLPESGEQFTPPDWWSDLDGNRPVVLVTQGTLTTDPDDLLVPTLRALADEDVLVVATTGGRSSAAVERALALAEAPQQIIYPYGHGAPFYAMPSVYLPSETVGAASKGLPANARVEPFIPFDALLPKVDLMITNGGFGGVQFALSHGVPLIVAGTTEEKPEIAARVAWSGAGINLKTKQPSPAQVRTAVREVLNNERYRRNAERISADYARHNAPLEAAILLERLAASGRAVLAQQLVRETRDARRETRSVKRET